MDDNTSVYPLEVLIKLEEIQKEARIHPDSTNPDFESRFNSIGALRDFALPMFQKVGLLLHQEILGMIGDYYTIRTILTDRATGKGMVITTQYRPPGQVILYDFGGIGTYLCRKVLEGLLQIRQVPDDDGRMVSSNQKRTLSTQLPTSVPRTEDKAETSATKVGESSNNSLTKEAKKGSGLLRR